LVAAVVAAAAETLEGAVAAAGMEAAAGVDAVEVASLEATWLCVSGFWLGGRGWGGLGGYLSRAITSCGVWRGVVFRCAALMHAYASTRCGCIVVGSALVIGLHW
jgi:hypothetical protein